MMLVLHHHNFKLNDEEGIGVWEATALIQILNVVVAKVRNVFSNSQH